MSNTRNLGQIQAVSIGDNQPPIPTMIWHNPALAGGLWLAFNYQTAGWQSFAGEFRASGLGAGQHTLSHGLVNQYPGTVLAFNGGQPVGISVVAYLDEHTITVQLLGPADVLIRP